MSAVFNCYVVTRELIIPSDVELLLQVVSDRELSLISTGQRGGTVEEFLERHLASRGITDPSRKSHFKQLWDRWEYGALYFLERHGWQSPENLPLDDFAHQLGISPWQAGIVLKQMYGSRNPRSRFLSQLLQWRLVEEHTQKFGLEPPPAIALVNYFEENHSRMSVAEMQRDLSAKGWQSQGTPMTELGIYHELQHLGISMVDFWERALPRATEASIEDRARKAGYILSPTSLVRSKSSIAQELVPLVKRLHPEWTDDRIRTEIARLIDVDASPMGNFLHYTGALPHGETWTASEQLTVQRLHSEGLPVSAIARLVLRTESSVAAQLALPSPRANAAPANQVAGPRHAEPHEILMKLSLFPGATNAEIAGMFPAEVFRTVSPSRIEFWRQRYQRGAVSSTSEVAPATNFAELSRSQVRAVIMEGGEAAKNMAADIVIAQSLAHRDSEKVYFMPNKMASLTRADHGMSYADIRALFNGDIHSAMLFTRKRAHERGIMAFTLLGTKTKSPTAEDSPEAVRNYQAILQTRAEDATRFLADFVEKRMEEGLDPAPRFNTPGIPLALTSFTGTNSLKYHSDPSTAWLALREELARRGKAFPFYGIRMEERNRSENFLAALRGDALAAYYRVVKSQIDGGHRTSWWVSRSESAWFKETLGFSYSMFYRSSVEQVPFFDSKEHFIDSLRSYVQEKEGIDIGFPPVQGQRRFD